MRKKSSGHTSYVLSAFHKIRVAYSAKMSIEIIYMQAYYKHRHNTSYITRDMARYRHGNRQRTGKTKKEKY